MTKATNPATAVGRLLNSKAVTAIGAANTSVFNNFPVETGERSYAPITIATSTSGPTGPSKKPSRQDFLRNLNTGETAHPQLLEILSTKRADGSVGDYLFRAWLLKYLAAHRPVIVGEGNISVTIGSSQVAFSCHVDTCHTVTESDGTTQALNADFGLIVLGENSGCLGADDGVGIFLMLQMIEQGVPGTYIFHTAEECGGVGSESINQYCREFTSGFDLIVAFDRAVTPGLPPEVITHQGGTRCASDECGQAIAEAFNAAVPELGFVISDRGVFTDTRNYHSNVSECLNIGCFYCDQHGPSEFVDIQGVNRLLKACLSIDWDALPTVRDPKVREPRSYAKWYTDTWPPATKTTSPHGNWPDKDDEDTFDADEGTDDVTAMRKMRDYYNGLVDQDEVDEEDRDNDTELTGDELDLYVAVDEATRGKFTELMDLLADYIYPEDTTLALRQLSRGKLTDDVLEDALVSLELGFMADSVKSQLVDACAY